jgi:putative transposase
MGFPTQRRVPGWQQGRSSPTMGAKDVTETLDATLVITGVDQVKVKHRPRLLSDNGPAYLSSELRDYLDARKMKNIRGAPYHPQTQGKIERRHRTMKNVVMTLFPESGHPA